MAPPRIPTPELAISPSAASTITSSGPPDSATKAGDEFISPAFIKRARTSYGSLFDSDYDPFAEDGTVPGKGRKRTRLSSTWRYSSRSPSPEAEEEVVEPVATLPEAVAKPTAVMTDEGCQTIGLEDDGAAETLANFARQSTNIGRDSYPFSNGTAAPKTVPQSENLFENTPMMREPPIFSAQHMDGFERLETNQIAPRSPHLQPVSSDFLPQVSPLLSRNALFPASLQLTEAVENSHSLTSQPQVPRTIPQTAGTEAEDIYGASPTRRRGEQTEIDVPGFHDPTADVNGVEPPISGGQYESEDQYGHWQSSAHLSHHASPFRVTEAVSEDAQADRFYVEEGGEEVEQYDHMGIPASHDEMLHSHQYPEIDDGLPDQQLSEWGQGASHVPYPELQGHIIGQENDTGMQPPQPRSAAMSRSQSGQSQVVDLTESSDEEEAGPGEGAPEDNGSLLEGDEEENLEDEDEEGSLGEQDEEVTDVVRSRHFPRSIPHDNDFEGEESEGEEQYYEDDELEEDGGAIDERFNVGPGEEFYDEEEEGSYESEDDKTADEGPPMRTVPQEPEVIDLLSSDDEDSGPPPQPKATFSAPSRHPQASTQGPQESEESEEDEDADGEDSVPYAEREELRIRNASREGSVEEEDEILEEEREQDSGDESAGEDANESEIDARDQRALARESSAEPIDDEPMEDRQGEENSFAVVEDAQNEDQHLETENLDGVVPAVVRSHAKAAIPGQFGRLETSPSKSSVFERLFNFDGANDDPDEDVSYPTLPKDEHSPPASDQQATSQTFETHLENTRIIQLPTPDATQSFGKIISSETSFASTMDQQQGLGASTIKMETEQTGAILETSGPLDVEVEVQTVQIETTTVIDETAKIKIDDEDVEMTQEDAGETTAEPKSSEHDPPAEKMVEEPMAEEETVEQEHILDTAESGSMELDRVEEQAVENEQGLEAAEVEPIEPEINQEQIDEQIVEEKLDLNAGEPEFVEFEEVQVQIDQQFAEEEHNMEVAESEAVEPEAIQEQIDEQILEEVESKHVEPTSTDTEPAEDSVAVEEPENTADSITVDSSSKQNKSLDVVSKEPEFTIESPRRSHRRPKPTTTVANKKENARPVTPTKTDNGPARQRREPVSPKVILDARAPPKGHDASIELALESLESPKKPQHDLRKPPVADLKLRLSRALRTELSEFTALKVLRYHLNQKLDVLAVATTTPDEPQRAKNGPRHCQITFNITDPSIAPSGVTEVQIFRPYKDALPTIQAGEGILLRNFQVISIKSRGFGLRSVQDEGSSWAVFKDNGEPEVRGPPVEFGDSEKNHVIALKAWYGTLDSAALAKISRANGDKAGAGVGKSIAKAS